MSTKQDKETAIAQLREWIKEGDTVYTILRHVSKSGMQREISIVLLHTENGQVTTLHPNYAVSQALGYPIAKGDAVKVRGCGMDMGFHLVDSLSYALFGKSYAIKHRWL